MKKYVSLSIAFIASLMFCGCEPIEDWLAEHIGHTMLYFKNNSNYKVSVFSIAMPPYQCSNVNIYPDTSLPLQPPLSLIEIDDVEPYRSKVIIDISWKWEEVFEEFNTDTIPFFVIRTDSLNILGWDSIRMSYNILQRYDVSIEDVCEILIRSDMTFPPSVEMKSIKMWPPYGTYDSSGQRIR